MTNRKGVYAYPLYIVYYNGYSCFVVNVQNNRKILTSRLTDMKSIKTPYYHVRTCVPTLTSGSGPESITIKSIFEGRDRADLFLTLLHPISRRC